MPNLEWRQIGNSWFLYKESTVHPRNYDCVGEIHLRSSEDNFGYNFGYFAYRHGNPSKKRITFIEIIDIYKDLDNAKAAVVQSLHG